MRYVTRKQAIEAAQKSVLLSDMKTTQQALDAGKLDSLMINTNDDGLLTTIGRFGEDTTKKIFGVESLPVLMKETRIMPVNMRMVTILTVYLPNFYYYSIIGKS